MARYYDIDELNEMIEEKELKIRKEKLIEAFYFDLGFYQITGNTAYLKCANHTLRKIKTLGYTDTYNELASELKKEIEQ